MCRDFLKKYEEIVSVHRSMFSAGYKVIRLAFNPDEIRICAKR